MDDLQKYEYSTLCDWSETWIKNHQEYLKNSPLMTKPVLEELLLFALRKNVTRVLSRCLPVFPGAQNFFIRNLSHDIETSYHRIIINLINLMIETGVDINKRDKKGRTYLYRASYRNKVFIVEHLLRSGAEVDLAAKNKKTPLAIAFELKWITVMEILVKNEANPMFIVSELNLANLGETNDADDSRILLSAFEKVWIRCSLGMRPDPNLPFPALGPPETLLQEVEMMRIVHIPSPNISLADIAYKPVKKLGELFMNTDIDKLKVNINRIPYQTQFPLHADILKIRIEKAIDLSKLYCDGLCTFGLMELPQLPKEVVVIILKNLFYNDVRNLAKAGSY